MGEEKKQSSHWAADLVAGLTAGIANIPDAMASAILAGTKPPTFSANRHSPHTGLPRVGWRAWSRKAMVSEMHPSSRRNHLKGQGEREANNP